MPLLTPTFPRCVIALSPAWTRPLVFQHAGPARNDESHTDRPVPPAPSSHGTTTEALLLPHPAASPVKPPRQRARPTWLPLQHSPFAALSPSPRPWSPNPLLAAQILSLSPAFGVQPVVDLFADPDHRTTRPTPPVNPWRVAWSAPGRLSLLMPPAHLAEHAVTKFLGENAVGVIALTDEASPAARRLAATAAHFTLRFPPHRERHWFRGLRPAATHRHHRVHVLS